jgi:hypothetical protein
MTEAEWLGCCEPDKLLQTFSMTDKKIRRKLWLLDCGCCRRAWHLLTDERSRRAVEVAEESVDGRAGAQAVAAAVSGARAAASKAFHARRHFNYAFAAARAAEAVASGPWQVDQVAVKTQIVDALGWEALMRARRLGGNSQEAVREARLRTQAAHSNLIRCVFAYPFRPATPIDPAWLRWHSGAIPQLAQTIYEERAPPAGMLDAGLLALLADMLTDAGCTDADILDHCRSGGEHVRGCWVVDALLGKQ